MYLQVDGTRAAEQKPEGVDRCQTSLNLWGELARHANTLTAATPARFPTIQCRATVRRLAKHVAARPSLSLSSISLEPLGRGKRAISQSEGEPFQLWLYPGIDGQDREAVGRQPTERAECETTRAGGTRLNCAASSH